MHFNPELGRLLARAKIEETQSRTARVPAIRAASLDQQRLARPASSPTYKRGRDN
jgi:hypothetical protein